MPIQSNGCNTGVCLESSPCLRVDTTICKRAREQCVTRVHNIAHLLSSEEKAQAQSRRHREAVYLVERLLLLDRALARRAPRGGLPWTRLRSTGRLCRAARPSGCCVGARASTRVAARCCGCANPSSSAGAGPRSPSVARSRPCSVRPRAARPRRRRGLRRWRWPAQLGLMERCYDAPRELQADLDLLALAATPRGVCIYLKHSCKHLPVWFLLLEIM